MKRIIIKMKLFLIRITRIISIICPKSDLLLYGLLIVLWMVFGFLSKYITDIHGDLSITYLRTLWNLRNSIFTSIVLAFSIGAFNNLRDYRRLLKRQHFLYVDSMDDFEYLFSALLKDDAWQKFHALYNDKCQEIAWELIISKADCVNLLSNDVVLAFHTIQDRLYKIDDQLKDSSLMVMDEEILALRISEAKKQISKIMMSESRDDFKSIKELIDNLLFILEELRFIWRRDLILDLELVKMEQNPQEDFYKRMWLPDFDIKMIRNW